MKSAAARNGARDGDHRMQRILKPRKQKRNVMHLYMLANNQIHFTLMGEEYQYLATCKQIQLWLQMLSFVDGGDDGDGGNDDDIFQRSNLVLDAMIHLYLSLSPVCLSVCVCTVYASATSVIYFGCLTATMYVSGCCDVETRCVCGCVRILRRARLCLLTALKSREVMSLAF